MGKNLLLYKRADYYELKKEKDLESISIISVTKYINDLSLIDQHYFEDIVDISSLSEFKNIQSVSEQVLLKFTDNIIFICEDEKWEAMSYELRFLFDNLDGGADYIIDNSLSLSDENNEQFVGNNRSLFFYHKDDYGSVEQQFGEKGYTIESISKLISEPWGIKSFNANKVVLDLSCILEYTRFQSITEDVVYKLEATTLYICDHSKKEKLEYELRFIFNEFKGIHENQIINDLTKISTLREHDTNIINRHKKIIDLNDNELTDFFSNFRQRLYGHAKFKDDIEEQIKTFKIFNKLGEHKILSVFIMGDSGVGKTEVARLIFDCLNGKKNLAKINFGNYSNEFSLSSLIGSARGYIGSEDGEIFMKVRDTDTGILLIDEFKKSNSTLFNYFLDVLESGKMTSSLGQEIDLDGFIIVFTSNISKENYEKKISPELRSRFDYKCIFTPLADEDKTKYLEFRAKSIVKKINLNEDSGLDFHLSQYLKHNINVSRYQNMRDLNKKIKKIFMQFLLRAR
ncbi:AAA family ATPase [Sphingobacterium oryzagri]|uniref:AAA family ATPase n=1 Tax=Sphingobacterium oryzagri TaxID=3025669 RepID=A0ABY7WK60_9SPHI|nr:AAA family ATPase [Sphingobacterium sp. KACC 22765]WDF68680.1 AAA family ATPase [Sphingobacterium sp. KACC 22765]